MDTVKTIHPGGQPPPKGHYSPGIEHNGLIFVSGQLPMDLNTREPITGSIDAIHTVDSRARLEIHRNTRRSRGTGAPEAKGPQCTNTVVRGGGGGRTSSAPVPLVV